MAGAATGTPSSVDAARLLLALDELDRDLGRVGERREAEIAEAARVGPAALEADRLAGRAGDPEDDPALDLLADDLGIDDPPAIDRADRARHPRSLLLASTSTSTRAAIAMPKALCAAMPIALPGAPPSQPPSVAAVDRQRASRGLSPSICIRKESGSIPAMPRQLVDEALGEEGGVAVRARAPDAGPDAGLGAADGRSRPPGSHKAGSRRRPRTPSASIARSAAAKPRRSAARRCRARRSAPASRAIDAAFGRAARATAPAPAGGSCPASSPRSATRRAAPAASTRTASIAACSIAARLELAAVAAADQHRIERRPAPRASPAARAAAARAKPGAWVGAQISSRSPVEPGGRGQRLERRVGGGPGANNGREARCAAVERVVEVAAAEDPAPVVPLERRRPAPRRCRRSTPASAPRVSKTGFIASTRPVGRPPVGRDAGRPSPDARTRASTPGTCRPPPGRSSGRAGCRRSARAGPRR